MALFKFGDNYGLQQVVIGLFSILLKNVEIHALERRNGLDSM